MSSHVYFTRIEHLYSYVNARPLFEIFGDGLVEVDSSTIGPHGTITIAGGQGQDGLEDGKYCIFSITDNEFSNLEQAQNGPRIRAREFMTKIRTVDNSQIREVVRIPDSYAIENYNTWNSDVINRVQPPMSKIVYLFNNEMVYGPFKYQLKDSQGYVFSPYAAIVGNSDPNIIKCYKEDELKSNKALFGIYDNQTERIVYGEYSRYILFLKSLPDNYTEIDCITDDSLKDLVSNFLSTEGMTKAERKDLKESIKALPKECISEKRRSRILQLAENGELAEIAIKMIPTVLSSDSETLNIILSRVFSNKDYVTKLYPFIREQEGFTDLLNRLDAERNTREHELESLKAQIEDAKNGQNENLNVSSEEIERLQISLQEKEREIEQYKKKSELARELSEMEEEKDRLDILRVEVNNQANKAKNALSKKLEEAYSDLAFDGTIASMMIEEAAKFEKERRESSLRNRYRNAASVPVNHDITTPSQLVDFMFEKLNNEGHRAIEKNDIANILLCVSQGFLTILAGEPGVGKTSLIDMVATLMGLNNPNVQRYTEVAVEKGWSSRRDLIGYYNPLTKVFDSSNRGVFDALSVLDAEKKGGIKEYPYWILLDEANLSQMEHYWADFMGICDLAKNNRIINLGEDYQFEISDTLRFLATINLDHTTESLSARLIDRAWIIKLENVEMDFDDYQDSELVNNFPAVKYSILQQLYDAGRDPDAKMDDILSEKFENIKDIFRTYRIPFSPRIIGMIKKYCIASRIIMNQDEDENSNSYVALDYAVAQKILPMINGFGEPYKTFIESLIEECSEDSMPKSNRLLRAILRNGSENMQNYQFFGR